MYLDDKQRVALNEFLAGGIWMAVKQALEERRPSHADPTDSAETSAHRAFVRKGYEQCLEDIKKLSTETPPNEDGAIPSSLLDEKD